MVLIKYNINKTSSICRSRKVKQKGVCVLKSVGERSEVGLESELQNIRREREREREKREQNTAIFYRFRCFLIVVV